METAETEVEEGRRDEGEEREEEEEPEDGAGREEAAEAGEKEVRGCCGALGGGEEGERRRLPPAPEEDPPHSLRFSLRPPPFAPCRPLKPQMEKISPVASWSRPVVKTRLDKEIRK